MRRILPAMLLLVGMPTAASCQQSAEDRDLALIPSGSSVTPADSSTRPPDSSRQIYVEDALSAASNRDRLAVPLPMRPGSNWFDLLFADARVADALGSGVTLNVAGRANLELTKGSSPGDPGTFRLDTREAFLSWAPGDSWFLDVGRINLKSGVALGYNPTDFFKTRAVVQALSSDPSVLRVDRLGAFMVRGQFVLPASAITIAFAPRLYRPTAIYSADALPTIDPMLDRTNAASRLLLKVSTKVSDELSPEFLLYLEGGEAKAGLNLTRGLGRYVVLYAEWAGGRQRDAISAALDYGRKTGSLPSPGPPILADDGAERFMSDLAMGASYTTASKVVFNLEYHFHQAGLSRSDLRRWFDVGTTAGPAARAGLWYLRSFVADQQEPFSRQSAFLRIDRQDAFIRNLELTGFANVDVEDGSALLQGEGDYFVSDRLTLGAVVQASVGRARSEFGSLSQRASLLLKLARFF